MFRLINTLAHKKYNLIYGEPSNGALGAFDSWHRRLVQYDDEDECLRLLNRNPIKGIRSAMPTEWFERFKDKQARFIVKKIHIQHKTNDWVIWSRGDCPALDDTFINLIQSSYEHKLPLESMTEYFFSANAKTLEPEGCLAEMWQKVIGSPIIPFDKVKRQQIIDNLGDEFNRHLNEWSQK